MPYQFRPLCAFRLPINLLLTSGKVVPWDVYLRVEDSNFWALFHRLISRCIVPHGYDVSKYLQSQRSLSVRPTRCNLLWSAIYVVTHGDAMSSLSGDVFFVQRCHHCSANSYVKLICMFKAVSYDTTINETSRLVFRLTVRCNDFSKLFYNGVYVIFPAR